MATASSTFRPATDASSRPSDHATQQTTEKHPRVLVIGLDGATWNLLDPLLKSNRLATLNRILSNGTRSILRSCIQPSSEQAWSAFATGKQNGKFGLFGFYQRASNSYGLEYINASHRRAPTLWRLLSDRGKRCLVLNVPLTWPVEPVNGALVSGLMTPGINSRFTFPEELRAKLLKELGEYIIDVDIERGESEDTSLGQLVGQVRRMSELQTQAALWLMDETPDWDFAMLVYRAPDILCHKFWRYQDPAHPLYRQDEADRWGRVIADSFGYLDTLMSNLLDKAADERTTVIVLSDHGFGPLTHAVYLNEYFSERGLLAYRKAARTAIGPALRAGVRQLNNPVINAAKQRAFEMIPRLKGSLHYSMAYGNIDWSRTRAYAVGTMGNVYLNMRGREPQGQVEPRDYDRTRDQVIDAMRGLIDPETNKGIFDAVYRREEIYNGPSVDAAPDVIGLIDGPYHVAAVDWRSAKAPEKGANASAGPKRSELRPGKNPKTVVEKLGGELLFVSDTSGQHRMDGILAAGGAGIAPGAHFTRTPQLIDLAPTVLHLLGEPVPEDMDGQVLNEMLTASDSVGFTAASAFANAALDGYSEEDAKTIEERLAGLGYLG